MLVKYNYDYFKEYIDELKRMMSERDINKLNKNLNDNWNNITGNIHNICNNNRSRFYTAQHTTGTVFKPYFSNIDIPNIPNCSNQVVLGIKEHIAPYFKYNKDHDSVFFLICSDMNWTENANNIFIRCASLGKLNDCEYPIRLLLPKDKTKLFNNKKPRVTIYELFTLNNIFQDEKKHNIEEIYKLNNNLFLWDGDNKHNDYDIIFIRNPYYDLVSGGKKYSQYKNQKKQTIKTKGKKTKNTRRKTKK